MVSKMCRWAKPDVLAHFSNNRFAKTMRNMNTVSNTHMTLPTIIHENIWVHHVTINKNRRIWSIGE